MEHRKRLETSSSNSFKFYKLTLLVLLSVNSDTLVSSLGDSKGLKKFLLQSTNNENFSFSLLSPDDQMDTNQTWKATEFQLYNISSILSDYPLVAHSIPLKNSSHNRYFLSKGKSASLTVTLKSFKQGILFLNFSYYIGKTVTNKSEITHQSANDTVNAAGNINLKAENGAISNSTRLIQNANTTEKISSSTPSSKVSAELNQSSMSASISSPLETLKILEPISIKTSAHRKRRSLVLEDASNTHAQVKHMKNRHESKNGTAKSTKVVTTKPTNIAGNSSIAVTNASSANVIDALTLKQAVEMIRSAAAVISKNSVPDSEATTPEPGNIFVTQPAGHTVVSSNSKVSHKNSITGPKNPLKATKAVSELLPPRPSALPKLKHKTRSHHKSKNGNNNNSKNEKKRRKNKNKKVDNVERSENGKSDVNDDKHKSSSSSSSSSSSEEKIEGHEGKKPKISYKMWRASLEKKNRPSGLYVTVNEDIVFDNWDGIWDKHYVLGKWTGLKALPNGKWNQTNLFLNWDDVTTPRDVKITFEWEPLSGDFELVLTDIDVSTLAYTDPCHCAPLEQSKDVLNNIEKTLAAEDKFNLSLNAWGTSENQSSMIVLKQNKDGKGNWEIIKVNSGDDESASDKIKDLDLFELPDNSQQKKSDKETHPEDILKAILEKWHDKDKDMSTTKSPVLLSPAKETIIILTSEHEHTTPTSTRNDATSHVDLIAKQASSPRTPPTDSVPKSSTILPPVSSSSTVPSTTTNTPQPSVKPSVTYPPTSEPATVSTSATTTTTTTIQTTSTTTPQSIPLHTTNRSIPSKMHIQNDISDSPRPVEEPQTVHFQSIKKSTPKTAPQRKTDNDTALIVCIATGSLTLAILLMVIKKRIDMSIRGKNATR